MTNPNQSRDYENEVFDPIPEGNPYSGTDDSENEPPEHEDDSEDE